MMCFGRSQVMLKWTLILEQNCSVCKCIPNIFPDYETYSMEVNNVLFPYFIKIYLDHLGIVH